GDHHAVRDWRSWMYLVFGFGVLGKDGFQAAGMRSIRTTAKANTATPKAAAESRTRGCSNFPAVPAKKRTVAKSTVLARYWPERLPASRAWAIRAAASARAVVASAAPRTW